MIHIDQSTRQISEVRWDSEREVPFEVRTDDRGREVRTDAQETARFSRDLLEVEAEILDHPMTEIKHPLYVPTITRSDLSIAKIAWRQMKKFGEAMIGPRAAVHNIGKAQVKADEESQSVMAIFHGYDWDVFEAAEGGRAAIDSVVEKGLACREVIERKLEVVAAVGDSTHGLEGLLNHSSVTPVTASNGDAGTPTWATKTADEILADLNQGPLAITAASKDIEVCDTVLMSAARKGYLASTPRTTGTDTTILDFWLRTNPHGIKNVGTWEYCADAGAGSTQRVVFYKRDPRKVDLQVPFGLNTFPEVWKGLSWEQVMLLCTIGVRMKRPGSVYYLDGV